MPKCNKSGLIPCPSSGVTGNRSKGLAIHTMMPNKKTIINVMIPVAYGVVYGNFLRIVKTVSTANIANTNTRNKREPALLAYKATHVYCCGMDKLLFSATYLTEKSFVIKEYIKATVAIDNNDGIV